MSFGFPRGRKNDFLDIPDFIKGDKRLLKRFIRGLADTDGSAHWRRSARNHYLSITWNCTSKKFAESIKSALITLGFKPNIYQHKNRKERNRKTVWKVQLQRISDVSCYVRDIGFGNEKRFKDIYSRNEWKRYMGPAGFPNE